MYFPKSFEESMNMTLFAVEEKVIFHLMLR